MIFDATPDDGRGSQPRALMARLVDTVERIEELWRNKVVDYSITDQWTFVRGLIRPPRGSTTPEDERPDRSPATQTPTRAFFFSVAAALAFWVIWQWSGRTRRRRQHPAAEFLEEFEKRLALAHIALEPGEDVEALTSRLRTQRHRLAEPVWAATRRYLEARFGQKPLAKEERRRLLEALGPPER
jgi:hypothetical protein